MDGCIEDVEASQTHKRTYTHIHHTSATPLTLSPPITTNTYPHHPKTIHYSYLIEVEINASVVLVLLVVHGKIHCGLVDARTGRQLPVGLQGPRLLRRVFVDHVRLVWLELTQTDENNVALRVERWRGIRGG
ncbi:hypothetical protein EON65_13940 [archaeon]|nr:MAG: hypothetical protein EON65_13940 [archaeon]